MRIATFLLAWAAMLFAVADAWLHTRPLLARRAELRARIEDDLGRGIARASERGAPPSDPEVAEARTQARELGARAAELRRAWYSGAARAADYLFAADARGATIPPHDERERLEQWLLALPADLRGFGAGLHSRLGLIAPSISEPLPTDPATIDEQTERAVAASHLAAALRASGSMRVEDALLERFEDGSLHLRLVAIGGLDETVRTFEELLGASRDAPPRELKRFRMARVEPNAWGFRARELESPPIRSELSIAFDFPGRQAAGGAR